jgi:hypothetical protein
MGVVAFGMAIIVMWNTSRSHANLSNCGKKFENVIVVNDKISAKDTLALFLNCTKINICLRHHISLPIYSTMEDTVTIVVAGHFSVTYRISNLLQFPFFVSGSIVCIFDLSALLQPFA